MQIYKIYQTLYDKYGAQGWWPLLENEQIIYHKNDYSYPKNQNQTFEVAVGSILTQNTTFASVVKSLINLNRYDLLKPSNLLKIDINTIKEAIKPSGYFNQKANYLLNFTKFFIALDNKIPNRDELLGIKGIGEETADSILLYGYNQPSMKIDAYTKRLFIHLKLCDKKVKYKELKNMIESEFKKTIKNKKKLIQTYQEFHALLVEHGKNYYSKKPYGEGCFLNKDILKLGVKYDRIMK
jgi:endonuclease-3 related protein